MNKDKIHSILSPEHIKGQPKTINEDLLIVTPSPRSNHGGQCVSVTDSSVKVETSDGSISITCGLHRSQLKNKQLAIKLINSALFE